MSISRFCLKAESNEPKAPSRAACPSTCASSVQTPAPKRRPKLSSPKSKPSRTYTYIYIEKEGILLKDQQQGRDLLKELKYSRKLSRTTPERSSPCKKERRQYQQRERQQE